MMWSIYTMGYYLTFIIKLFKLQVVIVKIIHFASKWIELEKDHTD